MTGFAAIARLAIFPALLWVSAGTSIEQSPGESDIRASWIAMFPEPDSVQTRKPAASRAESRETYLLARGLRGTAGRR